MSKKSVAFFIFIFFLCAFSGSLADTGTEFCMHEFTKDLGIDQTPHLLYTGVTKVDLTMRSAADSKSDPKGYLNAHSRVYIFGYDQTWLFCWDDTAGIYFIGRHNVDEITPIDPENTPAYGVIRNNFIACTAKDTALYTAPDLASDHIIELPANTRLSFWMINNGWAIVPYRRLVGYLFLGDVSALEPVAPSVEYAKDGDIISAFTTFYSMKTTELNIGRMENIRVGCLYISNTYDTGSVFNFNETAGPYREARGYRPSPVLVGGETTAGYGGGTCQVSTTLYNAILQLGDGIKIIWRRPHGPSGASYAPHGVDAAVGAENLNLIFENTFDFPITIDTSAQNGSLCICIRKGTI